MVRNMIAVIGLIVSPTLVALRPDTASKSKTIFLWDLHHVLMKPTGRVSALKKYPHKKEALRNAHLRRQFLKYALISRFKEVPSETFFELGDKYKNPYFNEMILTASVAQKPMAKTIAILQELKDRGYTHHVGSNMGITTFTSLADPQQHPEVAHIFKNFDLPQSHVVHRGAAQKPDPQFFLDYLTKNNLNPQTTRIIFIDDKKENIKAAESIGLEGIQFTNALQLRKALQCRDIDIKPLPRAVSCPKNLRHQKEIR